MKNALCCFSGRSWIYVLEHLMWGENKREDKNRNGRFEGINFYYTNFFP